MLLDEAKIGILTGSAVSATLGCLLLWMFYRNQSPKCKRGFGRIPRLRVGL